MEETKLNLTVQAENGELVIRHGEALELYHREGVKVTGDIRNPLEYAEKRKPVPESTHVIANMDKGTIRLICHETLLKDQRDVITGVLEPFPHFLEFKINQNHPWDPNDLANLFKRRRRYFPKTAENLELVKQLSNFKAAVETNLEKVDDKTGRRFKAAVEKTVNSGLPHSFTLKMPIIKSEKEVEFEVDLILEASDGRVNIYLDSITAEEEAEAIKRDAITSQIQYLEKVFPVFYE